MLHGHITFTKIAAAVGYKREHIGKMARPETKGKGFRPRITQFHKVLEVIDGLRIPGHLAGVAPRPWELERTATATRTDDPSTLIAKGGAGLWDIAEMLRRTEMSDINSAALESIEQGIDQLARAYLYADADYLHERTSRCWRSVMRDSSRFVTYCRPLRVHYSSTPDGSSY
ncbi:hypothetical protein ACIQVF_34125 [Streptomyces tendae]|uniref:hypothetical protein n=1 Tax=Streptomyces tendae TaxID=1932 RepID=UPI0037F659AB